MRLFSLEGNIQWLDGGAMFGNAPKSMWSRWMQPDDLNRIKLASRCLLVIDEDNNTVLFEVGIGDFFSPQLKDRYGVETNSNQVVNALSSLGIAPENIDCVVLSHLHFDHAGGLLPSFGSEDQKLIFPNAKIVVSKCHWERACHPHKRDKSSFLPELNQLILKSGKLLLVDESTSSPLFPWLNFHFSHGHTPGLLISELTTPIGSIVFISDVIPGNPWVHLPISMGYDRYPELLIEEKETILNIVKDKGGYLFFTHDPDVILSQPRMQGKKWEGVPFKLNRGKNLYQNL